jgi:hypothetical protein
MEKIMEHNRSENGRDARVALRALSTRTDDHGYRIL